MSNSTKSVTFVLPVEIVKELLSRCEQFGVDRDRLMAAVLLNHLNNKTTDVDIGWSLLDQLEKWEKGDGRMSHWLAHTEPPDVSDPPAEESGQNGTAGRG